MGRQFRKKCPLTSSGKQKCEPRHSWTRAPYRKAYSWHFRRLKKAYRKAYSCPKNGLTERPTVRLFAVFWGIETRTRIRIRGRINRAYAQGIAYPKGFHYPRLRVYARDNIRAFAQGIALHMRDKIAYVCAIISRTYLMVLTRSPVALRIMRSRWFP